MGNEVTLTGLQIAETQMNLRDALGLAPKHHSLGEALVMMSEEIHALRAAGKSDTHIVNLIKVAVGVAIAPEALAQYIVG